MQSPEFLTATTSASYRRQRQCDRTDESEQLDQQLYRGWLSIALGIASAGAAYPVVCLLLSSGMWIVKAMMLGDIPAPQDVGFLILMGFYALACALVGFLWCGLVMTVTLPVLHVLVWSLKPPAGIIAFGAFSGGLVGFIAVLPFLLIADGIFSGGTITDAVTMLLMGPALTTLLGQLGGAWGGWRAKHWSDAYDRDVAAASVRSSVADVAVASPRETGRFEHDASSTFRWQFGIRHLLWVAAWMSILLSLIRILEIPFSVAIPLLLGWVAFQAFTLWIGSLVFSKSLSWEADARSTTGGIP